ncbi:MAG: FAD-binding oxidoreductase [Saprospiraceae bacterium]|nr:FAD-binding oxidoreductase [Saprospiraceae bacterium]
MTTIDYFIIGQGLAGSLVALELLARGQKVMVIDPGHQNSSSDIAAGIINPITGRRFVKSWRIDEALPFAKRRYQEVSSLIHSKPFYRERKILRVLFSAGEENEWLSRTSQEGWSKYVSEESDLGEFKDHIFPGFSQGGLHGAQVDLPRFIRSVRDYLKGKGLLIEESFDPKQLPEAREQLFGKAYRGLIFCEGAKGKNNPLWSGVQFDPAKGEIFHLRIPGLKTKRILKHNMILAHLEDEVFWFGANYEWNAENDSPSEIGSKFLQKKLDRMIPNYEIVGHRAATRPTIRDRRPVLGQHQLLKTCFIFNGLGTKGASLGPLLAKEFVDFLLLRTPLSREIDLNRFFQAIV